MLTLSDRYIKMLKNKLDTLYPGQDASNAETLKSILRFDSRLENTIKEWIDGNDSADYVIREMFGIQEVMARLEFSFFAASSIINLCIDENEEKIKYYKENLEDIYALE